MPIVVICPHCTTKLSAPDSAVGKHVKCPRPDCGTIVEVPELLPAEEVPVVDATLSRPNPRRHDDEDDEDRPRKKSRRDENEDDEDDRPASKRKRRRDDDDDDYEFDHSRRRKRRKSGMGAGAIVAIVFGGLIVLAGIGFGVYVLVGGKDSLAAKKKAAPPTGWKECTYPTENFRAYFPTNPTNELHTQQNSVSITGYRVDPENTPIGVGVGVWVIRFPTGIEPLVRERAMTEFRQGFMRKRNIRVTQTRSVTWASRDAEEMILEGYNPRGGSRGGGALRLLVTDGAAYLAIIGSNDGQLTAEMQNGFFDSFELLK